jgi:ribulose-phosphate 3-epimerase
MVEIIPSILSADFARLADEIARVERGGASMLHLDIMDGHFVPNITFGPPVVESVRKVTKAHLDCHLMIEAPECYVPDFAKAGADSISVHQEACRHLDAVLRQIRSHGAQPGVVLNPATPVETIEHAVELADYVLLMSVNPGFGGQEFLPYVLDKVRQLLELRRRKSLELRIEIDGGVHRGNLAEVVRAGCEWIVTGSAVFHSADAEATVREMRQTAQNASAVEC